MPWPWWCPEPERTSFGRLEVWAKDDRDTIICEISGAPSNPQARADHNLIALAPTAPHDCDIPGCPGAETKRRLEAAEALLAALLTALVALQRGEQISYEEYVLATDAIEAAIAKAEGRQ